MAETRPATLTKSEAEAFIESVLKVRPQLAVFDCDGTLWEGDGGKDFLYWEAQAGLLPEAVKQWVLPRYESYENGAVDEETMCGEMVAIHAGIPVKEIEKAAEIFVATVIEKRIFPEMQKLVRAMIEQGCEIWAVSSTNNWVIEAGVKRFGIPRERVIAACVACKDSAATEKLIRVPTDQGKAAAINEVIKRAPDAVFGNSVHDEAMLRLAKHPFVINPNPDLLKVAESLGWPVYLPLP